MYAGEKGEYFLHYKIFVSRFPSESCFRSAQDPYWFDFASLAAVNWI